MTVHATKSRRRGVALAFTLSMVCSMLPAAPVGAAGSAPAAHAKAVVSSARTNVGAGDQRASLATTMFGDRRISVPSGGHFYGSQVDAMTPDGAHVFVRSGSDLTAPPAAEVLGRGGGIFDLIAGRAVRINCLDCVWVLGTDADGGAVVASNGIDLTLVDATGSHPITPLLGGTFKAISDDGSYVVVGKRNARAANTEDLYRWTRATGALQLISPGLSEQAFKYLSPDGTRVIFETGENLLGLDLGTTGETGIYQWTPNGVTLRGRGAFLSASPDGARVYMNTTVSLDPADRDAVWDGYVHDADGFHVLTEPSSMFAHLAVVKADGSAWVIGTAEALTPDDTDTTDDAYLATASSRTLLTRGQLDSNGILMDANFTSGIYSTRSRLDPIDTDDWDDVYRWSAATPNSPELLSGTGVPGFGPTPVLPLAYAADGSRAFMTSGGIQLPQDTDPYPDVYEFVNGRLNLAIPGDQPYNVFGWTPDLRRLVVSAGALTSEDTNGNMTDVYLSDADLTSPTIELTSLGAFTGPDPQASFGTAAGDGVWFDCRVDGGAWSRCTSPVQLTGLLDGVHQLDVRGFDAAANAGVASTSWSVDASAPAGSVSIAGGSTYTATRLVTLSVAASDRGSGLSQVAISNGGATWTTSAYAPSQGWTLPAGDGVATVFVKWRDAVGNWSAPSSDSIVLDTNAPTGSILISGGSLTTPFVAVSLSVPASDALSGVSQVALSNDGSSWTTRAYGPTQSWVLASGTGTQSVHAKWKDGADNWSAIKTDTIVVDPSAPGGTVTISAGATYTTTSAVTVAVPASAGSGIDQVALSNDGVTWTTRPYGPSQTWTLASTDGARTVYAKWGTGAGLWSGVATDTIILDTVGPSATGPTHGFLVGSGPSGGAPVVRLGWTATDETSGTARYELGQSTDGGAYATVSTSLVSSTLDRALAIGHTYRFRVRAIDRAGNLGTWTSGASFALRGYQETSSAIRYSGTWHTGSSTSYWGGRDRYASNAGATVRLTSTGRAFAWVGSVGPTRGSARIYVNGVLVRTISLYARSVSSRRLLFALSWSTLAKRTITIAVVGTAGHPRVDVDALLAAN